MQETIFEIELTRPHRILTAFLERVIKNYKNGEKVIILVPEQYTLMMEKVIIEELSSHAFWGLSIYSPSRLFERVLEEIGMDDSVPLSKSGQRMAVSQALFSIADKLQYYTGLSSSSGFVAKMESLINDLKRGKVDSEIFANFVETIEDESLKLKFKDIALLYNEYYKILRGKFSVQEDMLNFIAKRLSGSTLLNDTKFYVYGFDTLSQQLISLLVACVPFCKSMFITLACVEESAKDADLYLPVRESVYQLKKQLVDNNIPHAIRCTPYTPLMASPAIEHIDQYFLAQNPLNFEEKTNDIVMFSELSPSDEAIKTTRYILQELENGTSIERIVVMYPDDNNYCFALESALHSAQIPYISDQKMPLISHGLAQFILNSVLVISNNYQNNHIFAMMKSGYSTLTFEECCILEHYALKYGINRNQWLSPFTKGNSEKLEQLNLLRKKLLTPLINMRQSIINAKNSSQSLTALYTLLENADAFNKLKQYEEKLIDKNYYVRANQNSQVWQAILGIFNQLHRLSQQSRIPLKHLANRLQSGFVATEIAALPSTTNMLSISKIGHIITQDIDVVFIMGLNDGLLNIETKTLLTPEEKLNTEEKLETFLGISDDNRVILAKLALKKAMTLPKKKLYLSHAKTDPSGQAVRPLSLLSIIQNDLFANCINYQQDKTLPLSTLQALCEICTSLNLDNTIPLSLKDQETLFKICRTPEGHSLVERLLRSSTSAVSFVKDAKRLFGDETMSVSRLETFMECPFRHFITYGLRPEILRSWEVDPIETGSFYHAALHSFSQLAKQNTEYPNISDTEIVTMANNAVNQLIPELLNGPMGDGTRNKTRLEIATEAIIQSSINLTHQLAAGDFSLYKTEVSFGYPNGLPPIILKLHDGNEVLLRGRIDRIDTLETEDDTYVRIIDYKSSQKSLDAKNTWWGLQLQLLLYLDVCTQSFNNAKPAGAFYFQVANPYIKSDADIKEEVNKKLKTVFQLQGFTLNDVEINRSMDHSETPYVIKPIYEKSGNIKSDAKALDAQQFKNILKHAKDQATNIANQLLTGDISISPIEDGEQLTCSYCNFNNVCQFSKEEYPEKIRTFPNLNMDELRDNLSSINDD